MPMTIEIKVNGQIKEVVDVYQIPAEELEYGVLDSQSRKEGWRMYLVNNTFRVLHNRNHGIRVLARLALNAIKKAKA